MLDKTKCLTRLKTQLMLMLDKTKGLTRLKTQLILRLDQKIVFFVTFCFPFWHNVRINSAKINSAEITVTGQIAEIISEEYVFLLLYHRNRARRNFCQHEIGSK